MPAIVAGHHHRQYLVDFKETQGAETRLLFIQQRKSRFSPDLLPVHKIAAMNLQVVHVRINDGHGQPVPARVRITDEQGHYFPPLGRPAHLTSRHGPASWGNVLLGDKLYAYIDGQAEFQLPAGELLVELSKGPNYTPISMTTHLRAGQLSLRFNMEPIARPEDEGWYAGDTSVFDCSPQVAALEGAAEGLSLVHVQAYQDIYHQPWYIDDFSAQTAAAQRQECQVSVGTRNQGGDLGELALLYTHRVVFPLRLDHPGFEHYTVYDWCHQAHRKHGLVVWPDFQAQMNENLVALVLGEIDAVEWAATHHWNETHINFWYHLLNAGLHVPVVGGSGKRDVSLPIGALRTYAHLGWDQPFSIAQWVAALRAGKTVVSRGPLLYCAVGTTQVGETLEQPSGFNHDPCNIQARMHTTNSKCTLEIVADGAVIAARADHANSICQINTKADLQQTGWWAARAWDEQGQLLAHTSPIYNHLARPVQRTVALAHLLQQLDGLRPIFAQAQRVETQRQSLLHHLEEAENKLQKALCD